MSTEENKALMRRFCEEVFNQGKSAAAFQGPGYLRHRTMPDTAPGIFTDIHAEIVDQVAESDRVTSRWMALMTQSGDYTTPWGAVVPASGKQVTYRWISIDRIADGKVVEAWVEVDVLGWWQQIGAIPAPS